MMLGVFGLLTWQLWPYLSRPDRPLTPKPQTENKNNGSC